MKLRVKEYGDCNLIGKTVENCEKKEKSSKKTLLHAFKFSA